MTISALMMQDSQVRLWCLSSGERLQRQIDEMGGMEWLEEATRLPASGMVLLLNGNYLFEIRTLKNLISRPESVLFCPTDGRPAAAFISAEHVSEVLHLMRADQEDAPGDIPAPLSRLDLSDVSAFDQKLRFARPPLLELITAANRTGLENLLYGNSYRGITDLVTKFVWPRPARRVVAFCARHDISPNQITTVSLILTLAACVLFFFGYYFSGLLAGWIMTFLDTVDGKLARVTIQSSRFGDLFDHGIDLFHPPFWYIFWGLSLMDFQPVMGIGLFGLCAMVFLVYTVSRLIEAAFPFLGGPSVWTWRPFDGWFRLIVSRRNPCLIILTVSALVGRPDWGFLGVLGWSIFCAAVLFIRLLQGVFSRLTRGPLVSWLNADGVATGKNARSFKLFEGTRGAYAD